MGVLYEILDCGHELVRPGHGEVCQICELEGRVQQLEQMETVLGCLVSVLELSWNDQDKQIPEFQEAKALLDHGA